MNDPERPPAEGWTLEAYAAHNEALRVAEEKFQTERDRRYSEVNVEREKALKIKETADRDALGLAREIQTYKDEKANELRSQIERERGSYATQIELRGLADQLRTELKPMQDWITAQQGKAQGDVQQRQGFQFTTATAISILGLLALVVFAILQLTGR